MERYDYQISRDGGQSWGATTLSQVKAVIANTVGAELEGEILNEMHNHHMEFPGLTREVVYRAVALPSEDVGYEAGVAA